MKDLGMLQLIDDKIVISLTGGASDLKEITNGADILIQKIIYLLRQEEGSNIFNPDGCSLNFLLTTKISPTTIDDTKVKIHLLISKLEQLIKQEQEELQDDSDPSELLEKIVISNIDVEGNNWNIGLVIYDKAGGKTYIKV
jgi:hypothetical protein